MNDEGRLLTTFLKAVLKDFGLDCALLSLFGILRTAAPMCVIAGTVIRIGVREH